MTKSPLRYPGGKSKFLSQILPRVPSFLEYREPFVGGGSVFLALKQQYPDQVYWINDLYFELYLFWKQVQQDLGGMVAQVTQWRQQFPDGKELYQYLHTNQNQFTPLERASAFFVFNRITFSGTTESGGFSEQAFQKRFTPSSIRRLSQLQGMLSNTTITNLDYEAVVKAPGEGVFLYLDPPYYSATKSALYGKRGVLHKSFDHQRFAKVMYDCPHQWLITYDDHPYIRNLFSFACIREWRVTYGMRNQTENSTQASTELFLSNFDF